MDEHSVAVIIPAYNCGGFIIQTLESLERQTVLPDEIVVVDDGSTDNTADLVRTFASRSHLPVSLVSQENRGIAGARNTGVAHCSSTFIALLDGDDVFYPQFLERARCALVDHPELILCFSDRDVVTGEGEFIRRDLDEPRFREMKTSTFVDGVSVLTESPFFSLLPGNVIPIGNLMFRKTAFEKAGGFDDELRAVEDKPFLMRLTKWGLFGFIDQPLGTWRRHTANTSGAANAFKMRFYDDLALEKLEREASRWGWTDDECAAIRNERKKNPAKLLYTASDEANPDFVPMALGLIRDGRTRWPPVFKAFLRYGWRRVEPTSRRRTRQLTGTF
ncbi:MAG TPA: glycosyltransferase family 2 protein [Gammaproteobacteria bacterium]|nr:glycosyltransferase family 2 protein [Gammaproteobacteria bacterium]